MVKHDGKWGTVCDDAFGKADGNVACKSLGFTGMSSRYMNHDPGFTESDVPIWMDDVNCDSNVTDFLQCKQSGWGEENCGHNEDVLLTCDYKSDEQKKFDFIFGEAKIALWNMDGKYPYRKV